jgi:hypothetical protein
MTGCNGCFAGEQECLFPPCSFMEPLGGEAVEVTGDGVVGKVRVRLNANLKARCCNDLVAQKKNMHIAAFKYLLSDTARKLERIVKENWIVGRSREWEGKIYTFETVDTLLAKIMQPCHEALKRHDEEISPLQYSSDNVFRRLVTEMLDTNSAALTTLRFLLRSQSASDVDYLPSGSLEEHFQGLDSRIGT